MTDAPTASAGLDQVMQAIAAGDLARASRVAEEALAEGEAHPLLYTMRGLRNEGRGAFEEAVADFRAALDYEPADAGALNALGLCLARLGRLPEAVAELDRALAADPEFGGAAYNRGWALEMMGELAQARAAYERAAELEPGNGAALASLASIAARSGDVDTARVRAEAALKLNPRDPTAVMALAIADNGERRFAEAEARLNALLADRRGLSPHAEAVAEGLLADALDGQDRTAEAFAAYQAENTLQRRIHIGRFGAGRPESGADYVRSLSGYMARSTREEWTANPPAEPVASPASRHVFLLGFPRSGTTLLGQVLAAHPQVVTLDEKETLLPAVHAFMTNATDLDRLKAQPSEALEDYRRHYWRGVREMGVEPDGKVLVDKLPMNTLKLPLIAKLFPDAVVLFARRDPRDVVLSCFRRHFVVNPTTFEFLTLDGAANYYAAVMALTEQFEEKLPLDLRHQRHEDLVEAFEPTAKALCASLGVDWDPAMADFAARSRARDIATPSAGQVAAGLTGEGVGQWRRYREQLAGVLPVLAPWVERLGYPAD